MSCIIYHYCSFDTLKKILESQCFWLTSHKYMNDIRERNYAFYLVNKKLETLSQKLNQQQLQNLQQFFYLLDISFNELIPETFMCCFSRMGDELPQWYQYANNGEGVALGIDVEEITKNNRPPFANGSTDESLSYCELLYEKIPIVLQFVSFKNRSFYFFLVMMSFFYWHNFDILRYFVVRVVLRMLRVMFLFPFLLFFIFH